ncbi:hypothetical protein CNMCM5623_003733 [Aspergillus felis]|uniref:Secreted protein n=1 Tax=Aspergillus felis TaxID=1287682 RepID=A0A8H6V3X5_9EURO|nr:hypothetical protein CNMCM5623_003733 [Aspergillus felis]KAF7177808.1 hypothetical protein CNMCM7691_006263 [Aspergillus felis]
MVMDLSAVIAAAIVIASVISELGDACFAEGNQSRCLIPVADALDFGPVIIAMHVTVLGDANHQTTDGPAAIRDIITVELSCERNVVASMRPERARSSKGRIDAGSEL